MTTKDVVPRVGSGERVLGFRSAWLGKIAAAAMFLVGTALAPAPAAAYDRDDRGYGWAPGSHGHGRYGAATVTVANQFDGGLEVWIDGRFVELVPGNATRSVMTRPGYRDVTLRRPQTGFVVTRTQLALRPGQSQFVPVAAPIGQMFVQNGGRVALKLQVDQRVLFVEPGQQVPVAVETGNVRLLAWIRDPRGEWEAVDKTVWLEPGQTGYQTLIANPGVLVVTNRERFGVRALVDGVDVGFVAPGDTRRIWLRPGTARVVLLDSAGRTRTSQVVTLDRGREEYVTLQYGMPCEEDRRLSVVAPADPRPAGPVRVGWYDDDRQDDRDDGRSYDGRR